VANIGFMCERNAHALFLRAQTQSGEFGFPLDFAALKIASAWRIQVRHTPNKRSKHYGLQNAHLWRNQVALNPLRVAQDVNH